MTMLNRILIISTILAGLLLGSNPATAQEVPARRWTTTGAGIRYHLSPSTALDSWVRHAFGNVRGSKCNDSAQRIRTCASSTRVSFGAT
jgi:hypothetical protein